MEIHKVKNYRKFNIKYLNETNHRMARIKIYEPKRYNDDKLKSVILSSDGHDFGQQGLNYLISKGFKPVARCSEYGVYTILCDNWGENFIELVD